MKSSNNDNRHPIRFEWILYYRIAQRIRIARANRLRMSSTAFVSADRQSKKSERKHKFSQSFVSIPNSRSSLLSDVEQKARQEEMENLNHSDKSNIAESSPVGSIFRNNHLNTNEPFTEGNHNDCDLPSQRKRSKELINSRYTWNLKNLIKISLAHYTQRSSLIQLFNFIVELYFYIWTWQISFKLLYSIA